MHDLRIGLFLGIRQIQSESLWSTFLIIIVIVFTFLNLVVISGILLGIVDGVVSDAKNRVIGDLIIKPHDNENRVLETQRLLQELSNYPEIKSVSPRYNGLATIEANYQNRQNLNDEPDVIVSMITGIDPVAENLNSGLASLIKEGEYLNEDDSGYLLLGKENIDRYAAEFGDVFESLDNIYQGSKVMVTVGEQSREFIIKGIVDSKLENLSFSIFMHERDFRRMFARDDNNANEISITINPEINPSDLKSKLADTNLAQLGEIRTFTEDIPKFIVDVRDTFTVLSIFTGAIGLAVASITIFIVIFINALSRRRQIGILKALGITSTTIEFAYITQAMFYTLAGTLLGMVITYFILIPYFIENPIDFPLSDASLSVSNGDMFLRSGALLVVTFIAGFIPAWMIVRQNTLNSILGRK